MKKTKKKAEDYIFIPQDNIWDFSCADCCFNVNGECVMPIDPKFDCYGGIYKLKDEPDKQ